MSYRHRSTAGRDRADRLMLTVAALWNWAVSLPFLLADGPVRALLKLPPNPDLMSSQLFFSAVFFLGCGYLWVARAPGRNHAMLGVGALIKLAVFGIGLTYWLKGALSAVALAPASIDLVFACLFAGFLIRRSGL
jgi:hypothetical protein